jgi:hypothetical protein
MSKCGDEIFTGREPMVVASILDRTLLPLSKVSRPPRVFKFDSRFRRSRCCFSNVFFQGVVSILSSGAFMACELRETAGEEIAVKERAGSEAKKNLAEWCDCHPKIFEFVICCKYR